MIWNLITRKIVLKLAGHRSSLINVSLVTTPEEEELVVSTDCEGTIKIWSIENLVTDVPISPLQTITLTDCQQVSCCVPAFSNGNVYGVWLMYRLVD